MEAKAGTFTFENAFEEVLKISTLTPQLLSD
jgi:hypothetical protein